MNKTAKGMSPAHFPKLNGTTGPGNKAVLPPPPAPPKSSSRPVPPKASPKRK